MSAPIWLQRIKPAAARARWYERAKALNASMPSTTYTVMVKGNMQTRHRPQKAVCDGAITSGAYFIYAYATAFNKLMDALGWRWSAPVLPSLSTNGERAADDRSGLDARSIRRHKACLVSPAVGLISGYKFHGHRADYELWLDPKILWGEEVGQIIIDQLDAAAAKLSGKAVLPAVDNRQNPVDNARFSTENPLRPAAANGVGTAQNGLFSRPQSTNCPLTEGSYAPILLKETETGTVQNAGPRPGLNTGSRSEHSPGGYRFAFRAGGASVGPQKGPSDRTSRTEANERSRDGVGTGSGSAAGRGALGLRSEGADLSPQIQKMLTELVEKFWSQAWKTLYPKAAFSPEEVELAQQAILGSVYLPAIDHQGELGLKDLATAHSRALHRLELARRYYARNRDRYAPLPYAKFIPGRGYFDAENRVGFAGTSVWLDNELAYQAETHVTAALARAAAELAAYAAGTAPARTQNQTQLHVFRRHEMTIRRLGGQPALARFYAQVAPFASAARSVTA